MWYKSVNNHFSIKINIKIQWFPNTSTRIALINCKPNILSYIYGLNIISIKEKHIYTPY